MRHIRRWVYRLGYRPKYPSILFSPTLHMLYQMKDVDFGRILRQEKDE